MKTSWKHTSFHKRTKSKQKKKVQREYSMVQRQVVVGVMLLVTIGLVLTAVWYVTRIDSLQIETVEVVGGLTIPHDEIINIVMSDLDGTYLKLIPKSFWLLFPKKTIRSDILNMSRVKNVAIEQQDKQSLLVVFEEYRPYALWCENAKTQYCTFLDEVGYSFAEAPALTGSIFVRYIETDVVPQVKKQAFDKIFIKQTQEFADWLADELDLYVVSVEKVQDLDVLYTVAGGGILKVSQTMSPETSFKNLRSILSSEQFIHLQNGAFQYIDLRFGDKIFLNEEPASLSSTTSDSVVDTTTVDAD